MPKKLSGRKLINIGLLCLTIVACLLIGELASRLFIAKPYVDPELGWAWRYPSQQNHTVQDTASSQRNVTAQYFDNGFKRWGEINTTKKKVFIIGDSFTEMWHVNNGEEWYSYLERAFPNSTFFVYGVGGWGTTQESLLLNKYYSQIKPDIIIWQFHYNDFINNYYPADRQQYPLNSRELRPYLENGSIVLCDPVPFVWLREHSALAAAVLRAYDGVGYEVNAKNKGEEFYNKLFGQDYRGKQFSTAKIWNGNFTPAYQATNSVFGLMRENITVPVYLFLAENELVVDDEVRALCAENNMAFIPGVAEYVHSQDKAGEEAFVPDGHWNLRGNALVGEYLVNYFKKEGVLR